MGQAIPKQHPAVVLRTHYRQLQALLAIAMVAVVGLSGAVVMVANDDDVSRGGATSSVQPINYGDFNPATGRPQAAPLAQQNRFDGGLDESRVAAAIGSKPETDVSRPDEAKIAATVGRTGELPLDDSRPDESKTAAAISGD